MRRGGADITRADYCDLFSCSHCSDPFKLRISVVIMKALLSNAVRRGMFIVQRHEFFKALKERIVS